MNRTILEGYAFAALFLAVQFIILAIACLDPGRLAGKPLWLHPGLAVASGFAAAGLFTLSRRLHRRFRPRDAHEHRP